MNTAKGKSELDELKKREYYKQQQQLRSLAKRNAMSADAMIENLLSRKEIFQKKKDVGQVPGKPNQDCPGWLVPGSPEVPWVYQTVWEAVGNNTTGLADTAKLSTLLMSSRLSTDMLGYIWALANKTVPGSLTQKEVYIALALVALAQGGQTLRSEAVLEKCTEAPVPRLELGGSQVLPTVPTVAHALGHVPPPTLLPPVAAKPRTDALSTLSALDLNGAVGSLPDPTDFGEFQSVYSPLPVAAPPLLRPPLRPPEKSFNSVDVLNLTLSGSLPPPSLLRTDDILTGREPADDEEFDDFKTAELPGSPALGPLTVLDLPKPLEPPPSRPPDPPVEDLFPKCPVKKADGPSTDLLDLFESEQTSSRPVGIIAPPAIAPPDPPPAAPHVISSSLPPSIIPPPEDISISPPTVGADLGEVEEEVRSIKIGEPVMEAKAVMSSGVSEDKYKALRMLEEEVVAANTSQGDDFGDFLTAETLPALHPLPLPNNQPSIQVRCLTACLKVLRTGLTTLEAIKDPDVLGQVTSSPKGSQYLLDLVEVHRVGERLKGKTERGELQRELDEVWQALEPYTKDLVERHMEDEDGAKCGVCLCEVGPSHVRYGINNFHAPCANFFLHCVDPVLPIAPIML